MQKTENVPLLSESHAVYCPLTSTKDCILNHYIVFPYIYLYPFLRPVSIVISTVYYYFNKDKVFLTSYPGSDKKKTYHINGTTGQWHKGIYKNVPMTR